MLYDSKYNDLGNVHREDSMEQKSENPWPPAGWKFQGWLALKTWLIQSSAYFGDDYWHVRVFQRLRYKGSDSLEKLQGYDE